MSQRRHDHGENDERDSTEQQGGVAFRRQNVTLYRTDDEREADAHRKRDRHSRGVNAHHQQEVRYVEDHSAEQGGARCSRVPPAR